VADQLLSLKAAHTQALRGLQKRRQWQCGRVDL
jgi:hypothetical protein